MRKFNDLQHNKKIFDKNFRILGRSASWYSGPSDGVRLPDYPVCPWSSLWACCRLCTHQTATFFLSKWKATHNIFIFSVYDVAAAKKARKYRIKQWWCYLLFMRATNLLAAGATNLLAAGGTNLLAGGATNLLAAGGTNLLAAGAPTYWPRGLWWWWWWVVIKAWQSINALVTTIAELDIVYNLLC